jgi:hypothetical protein
MVFVKVSMWIFDSGSSQGYPLQGYCDYGSFQMRKVNAYDGMTCWP